MYIYCFKRCYRHFALSSMKQYAHNGYVSIEWLKRSEHNAHHKYSLQFNFSFRPSVNEVVIKMWTFYTTFNLKHDYILWSMKPKLF